MNGQANDGERRAPSRYLAPLIACLTLGLAPFMPEPHIVGKLRWVVGGGDGMGALDWFDLLFRAYPVPTYIWQRQGDDFILVDYKFNSTSRIISYFFSKRNYLRIHFLSCFLINECTWRFFYYFLMMALYRTFSFSQTYCVTPFVS